MTTYADWRVGPDPMACRDCGAREAACDNKQTFAARRCCESCDHRPDEGAG